MYSTQLAAFVALALASLALTAPTDRGQSNLEFSRRDSGMLPPSLQNCCYPSCTAKGCLCSDGSMPTPYCGIAQCNMMGCDCTCR